jgi:hypothetical protein
MHGLKIGVFSVASIQNHRTYAFQRNKFYYVNEILPPLSGDSTEEEKIKDSPLPLQELQGNFLKRNC